MMEKVRLVLVQLNPTVGDIEGNSRLVVAGLDEARRVQADIVAFPELCLTGYPPEDLLLKPDFIQAARTSLKALMPETKGVTAIIGLPYNDEGLRNAAAVLQDGALAGLYYKQHLPNYGVFDEARYFQPGSACPIFTAGDMRLGVTICEDIWYPNGPHECQARQGGAQLLINISASPYRLQYGLKRERMMATRAADNMAFVAYCNLVGGQDELVFDGHSLICDPDGEVIARGPQFKTATIVVDLDFEQALLRRFHEPARQASDGEGSSSEEVYEIPLAPFRRGAASEASGQAQTAPTTMASVLIRPLERVAEVYQALVLGTRDYAHKNGFKGAVLGLSGGIDSSLTAVIASEALGKENVVGVSMPSRFSSKHSLDDAEIVAANLGINLRRIPIDDVYQAFLDMLSETFAGLLPDTTEENLQARIRGTVLMALSNKFGWLVLTTSNKSEVAVGYFTVYGDSAGGFSVIKDVPKMLVYEIGRYVNDRSERPIIPERVFSKAPSAELRAGQKDSDALPEYEIVDPILHAYVEDYLSPDEIVDLGFSRDDVQRVVRLIDSSEFKRRQSPPGIKILPRAFGKDWRLPITNAYRPRPRKDS